MFNFFKVLFSPVIAILDFITKYFKTIVFLTIVYFITIDSSEDLAQNNSFANLQKIELTGPILDVTKTLEDVRTMSGSGVSKGAGPLRLGVSKEGRSNPLRRRGDNSVIP